MRIGEPVKHHFVEILYYTLRQCRKDFNPNEYKWVLGAAVIYDLDCYGFGLAKTMLLHKDEKATLFGIPIEVDYENPNNLQLFEDITNKISVPAEEVDPDDK